MPRPIWIATADGRAHKTSTISYPDALAALGQPDRVLEVVAQTFTPAGATSPLGLVALPVRNIVSVARGDQEAGVTRG